MLYLHRSGLMSIAIVAVILGSACTPATPAAPTSAPVTVAPVAPKPAAAAATSAPVAPTAVAAAPKLTAGPLTKVTVTSGAHVMGRGPFWMAQGQGWFKEAGLDVDAVTTGGGAVAIAAILSGDALLAGAGGTESITAALKGDAVRIVGTVSSEFGSEIIVRTKLAKERNLSRSLDLPSRLQALKGLRIGVTSAGSSTDQLARFLVKKGGMDPDRDVEIVALREENAMLGALAQESIDAIVLSPPTGQVAESRGSGVVLISPLRGDVPELKGHIFSVLSASTKAMQDPVKKRQIVDMLKGVARAEKMLRTDTAAAKALLRKEFGDIDDDVFNRAFEPLQQAWPANPIPTEDSIKVAIDFIERMENRKVDWKYENIVDKSAAEQAVRELS